MEILDERRYLQACDKNGEEILIALCKDIDLLTGNNAGKTPTKLSVNTYFT